MRSSSIKRVLASYPAIKCPFEKGTRYTLLQLHHYLRRLETIRQSNKEVTAALQRLPSEFKEVFDELYPLDSLRCHARITLEDSYFVWAPSGKHERGIDFILCEGAKTRFLQITVTGPVWPEALPKYANPGYQRKLMLEKLSAEGMVSGWGAPRNVGGRIVFGDEGAGRLGHEVREAFRVGIIKAYNRKRYSRPDVTCELVVELNDTGGLTPTEFCSIVEETRSDSPLDAYAAIHVLASPDGHFASIERNYCRAQ